MVLDNESSVIANSKPMVFVLILLMMLVFCFVLCVLAEGHISRIGKRLERIQDNSDGKGKGTFMKFMDLMPSRMENQLQQRASDKSNKQLVQQLMSNIDTILSVQMNMPHMTVSVLN